MQHLITTLHVGVLFIAFALAFGAEVVLHQVARSGEVRAIRTVFRSVQPLGRIAPLLFLAGVAVGVVAIFTGGFNPFALWLLLSYAIYIAMALISAVVGRGWQRVVLRAAMASPEDAPSPELSAALASPRGWFTFWVTLVAIAAIVALMVFKPGR